MSTYASNVILHGDAGTILKTIPEHTVQMCVTSPPYYGLRNYDVPGQIGLEETPEHYIERLVEVFREVKRVLRKDGSAWINLGDSWQAKQLLGIPWRVAFALQSDGWILRSDVIWSKSNAMPESVTDRPTKSHEYLFLLAKNERYYYDADAIREPHTLTDRLKGRLPNFAPHQWIPNGKDFGNHNRAGGDCVGYNPMGRNKRSVWTISTQSYSEAHFATFPPKLIEPCILAGSSPRACEQCGAGWERGSIPTGHVNKREPAHAPHNCPTKTDSTGWAPTKMSTNEWQPTCHCLNSGTDKCIILDPFMGAGTTALVALQHGRRYLGVELNTEYIALAEKRIAHVQQNLWTSVGEAVA